MHNVKDANGNWDLTKCMLDETQVYEAQLAECGALIEFHSTRKAAQKVADAYTAQFGDATRVAVSWIYDMPESVAQRKANNES